METRIFSLLFLSLLLQSSHGRSGSSSSGSFDPTRVIHLSWNPRIFLYKGFLSHKECDHLINLAKDKMQRSLVVDDETGQSMESTVRTSSGMFLKKSQDDVVSTIENRIGAWTFLPSENGENLQILHYEYGQQYEPHFDVLPDEVDADFGGHRTATVLMYLSDVAAGGETVFPDSPMKHRQLKGDDWSDCAKQGFAVKPSKGDALLFFSLHPNGTTDPMSLHGSCPVIKGDKWSATKWIHIRSYNLRAKTAGDKCVDENESCAGWAAAGECEKNPVYMVGSEDSLGYCRKSCKACS
ncbi:probable prolyl 4-hydroxylase 6 [Andrographis paniculata]|uniref:probable prolyl 4-hydroxylase 6 n=1 Tax=Andrographis paniculata TaxID=175694 RepID=UPI0021E8C2A4|nr:probable prolyl 4-hydroxylase 6 [Andrographis paniculata]